MNRLPLRRSLFVFALAVIASASAWAYGAGGGAVMDGCWGPGHAFFGPLAVLVVPVVFIVAVVFLIRGLIGGRRCTHFSSSAPQDGQGVSPMDILNERFAKGEIDAEEYKERKRVLSE